MVELPRGTVTLIFTDIEGSTRLLASLGSRYEAVLGDHRRLLRDAFSSHAGIEVDTQGDALFYAFAKAHDAVSAAVEVQRALSSHEFSPGVELRVRMGIHTGEPTVTDEGYVGPDVHLGARICAAAWGAQIVVSSATAGLLSSGSEDITLRLLGDHALKDIDERVELFQVVAPGLTEEIPALRTKGTHPTNLPPRLASLIGREQDLATLKELLGFPETSVVTLTGPGGTGKTSLAAALGAQLLSSFPDGVFFVDLSALNDPSLVMPALAHTLALKETPGRTLQQSLAGHLSSKVMLLILDNLEQVIDAAPEVSALLTEAPSLKLVITSREALRIKGERVVSLAPLELPAEDHDDLDEIARSAAVALFTERARAVKQDFTLTADYSSEVAAICRRLDGLPLALELAAARINLLSPSALLARLDHSLKLLTSGRRDAAQRQKTLKGAIEWSYELLSPDEQRIFCRLGVFAGGWSLEAAEQVCDRGDLTTDVLDGLSSLMDKSLVRAAGQQERFTMLETIREFSLEKLEESGEAEEVRRAHTEYFRALAEEAEPHLVGAEQKEWLDELELERANLRAALEWSVARRRESALVVCAALWRFWRIRGTILEGRKWLDESLVASRADSAIRARAMRALSILCDIAGDYDSARRAAEEAAALHTQLNDQRGIADSVTVLAGLAQEAGDLDEAKSEFRRVREIYEELDDTRGVAVAIGSLGNIALLEQSYDEAVKLAAESMRLYDTLADKEGVIHTLITEGFAHQGRDSAEGSARAFQGALSLSMMLSHKEGVAVALEGLAGVAVSLEMVDEAARLLGRAQALRGEGGLSRQALEDHFYQSTLAVLRDRMTMDRLQEQMNQGKQMDVESLSEPVPNRPGE